jgi:peroxiredoxin
MKRILTLALALLVSLGAVNLFAADTEGTKAPDFRLKDLSGKQVKLSEALKNGPILIDFWATWCQPCKQALPHLDKIYIKYKEQGFQMYAISIDNSRSVSKIRPYVKSKKYQFGVLLDTDSKVLKKYRGTTVPHTVLIGTDGMIKKIWMGYHAGEEIEVEAEVAKLFAEESE